MATGDSLLVLRATDNEPPDADYATLDTILTTSSDEPDAVVPVLDCDPGVTQEYGIISFVMPDHYDGGGITIDFFFFSEGTSGNFKLDAAFKRLNTGANLLTKTFAAVNTVTQAADGTARNVTKATITFTNGADMDSVVANDPFQFLWTRDSADGADTVNSNDLEMWLIHIKET